MDKPRYAEHPQVVAKCRRSPEFYFRKILGIEHLTDYQVGIANSVCLNPETAARSANGVGKSFVTAMIANWWFDTRLRSKVIIAAPKFQQAQSTFSQAMILRQRAPWELDGRVMAASLEFDEEWYVRPRAAKDAERFQGVHAQGGVLLCMEEASGQTDEIYQAAYGCVTGDSDHVLHIGNPTKPVGVFANLWKQRDVECFTISAYQSPNVMAGRTIVPGLIGKQGVQRLIDRFGANSDTVRVRVKGLPPEGAGNGAFGFQDINDAKERALTQWDEDGTQKHPPANHAVYGGMDTARMGDDRSSIVTIMDGCVLPEIEVWEKTRSAGTIGRGRQWLRRYPRGVLNIDLGYNPGVFDALRDEFGSRRVIGTDFGARQALGQFLQSDGTIVKRSGKWQHDLTPLYANRRAELWLEAAEWTRSVGMIHPGFDIQLMEELEADLLGPEIDPKDGGSVRLEPKRKTKERTGMSPDLGDAYCLAVAALMGTPSQKDPLVLSAPSGEARGTIPARRRSTSGVYGSGRGLKGW